MKIYFPNPGHEWNPMRKHPNLPCFCQNGLKAKKCHGRMETVPADHAELIRQWIRSFGRKP